MTAHLPSQTLVVGGTGILRPAVHALCARGHTVGVVGRYAARLELLAEDIQNTDPPGNVLCIPANYGDSALFSRELKQFVADRGTFAAGIAYCPTAPIDSLNTLGHIVDDRLVILLTSMYGDPNRPGGSRGYPDISRPRAGKVCFLLLGWHTGAGIQRWHTPEEISEAALSVLAEGRDATLGSVRPWAERPR